MTDKTLEAVLRRDRLIVAGALGVIVAVAWAYVLWLAADMDMGGMDMTGFRMIPAGAGWMAPAAAPWRGIEFAFVFAMWAVMMVGMMAPSAAPMILMYARVGRQGRSAGRPIAATGWFAAGYFIAWTGFALIATLVQWALERAALLDPRMAGTSNTLGAVVLIAAGLYQWTPLKDVCLAQCQTPFGFLMRHGGFRSDVPGCLMLGLRHGTYCVGCCWVLMALLFVVGVMNVLWIALLALLVLLEKLTPRGRWIARAAGAACIAAGTWMLLSPPAAMAGRDRISDKKPIDAQEIISSCAAAVEPMPGRDFQEQNRSSARLAEIAETQPLYLLLALRANDSPLHAIQPHPGIEAMAAMIADGGDSPGIEPAQLELLVRTVIYMDRVFRAPNG